QRTKRRRAIAFDHQVRRFVKLARGNGHACPIKVDRAEDADVRLIPAEDVLDIAHVGFRPGVVSLPGSNGIAARHLDKGYKALLVQIVNLAIHVLEIGRVDPLYVRTDILIPWYFAGEQKGTPAL